MTFSIHMECIDYPQVSNRVDLFIVDGFIRCFILLGKFVDRRMDELGATRVHELGLGDAALGIEDDFQHWKESFTKKVLASYGEAAKTL